MQNAAIVVIRRTFHATSNLRQDVIRYNGKLVISLLCLAALADSGTVTVWLLLNIALTE